MVSKGVSSSIYTVCINERHTHTVKGDKIGLMDALDGATQGL